MAPPSPPETVQRDDAGDPRDRILTTARALFFEKGYANVSTSLLAREAAVSKSSIYKHFQNMHAVFEAVVDVEVRLFETGFATTPGTLPEFLAALIEYGVNLMRFLNRDDVMQLDQIMLEEARDHPEATRLFFESTYERTLQRLATLIQLGRDNQWILHEISAMELAEQLASMWKGFRFSRAQFRLTSVPFQRIPSWSKKCVSVFLGPD